MEVEGHTDYLGSCRGLIEAPPQYQSQTQTQRCLCSVPGGRESHEGGQTPSLGWSSTAEVDAYPIGQRHAKVSPSHKQCNKISGMFTDITSTVKTQLQFAASLRKYQQNAKIKRLILSHD